MSAMHQTDFTLFERSRCKTDMLIINQTDQEGYDEKIIDGCRVRMYSTTQRGLSRSRNMALVHAAGDICLFADDDCVMNDGYENMVLEAFDRNERAVAIAFNYSDPNRRTKKGKIIKKEGPAPRRKSFSSVSLAFQREIVLKNSIWFDVRLGAGSGVISAGEETVWEDELRKKGLLLYQCPKCITEVQQQNSTWFNGFNGKYFYDLGAILSIRYSPILKYIYQFYYPLRLKDETSLTLLEQLRFMLAGMNGIKNGKSYNQYFKIDEKI